MNLEYLEKMKVKILKIINNNMKEKQKTYQCIEHGEIFYIDAINMEQAIELASMYGGSVIKEVKLNK
mgnify:CR=1 FL=1